MPDNTNPNSVNDAALRPVPSVHRFGALIFIMYGILSLGYPNGANGDVRLPVGRTISPSGTQQNVGSLPVNMALTSDGKFVIVTGAGFRQYLCCLNAATGKLALPVTRAATAPTDGSIQSPPDSRSLLAFTNTSLDSRSNGLYYGLAVHTNADGSYTAYVSQGGNAKIAVVHVASDGALTQTGSIALKSTDFAAGIALDNNNKLYVAVNDYVGNSLYDAATTPGSMAIYDLNNPAVIHISARPENASAPELERFLFNGPDETFGTIGVLPALGTPDQQIPFTPTNYPFAVVATRDGSTAFVTSERDGVVYKIAPNTPGSMPIRLQTGSHPISLLLSTDDRTLFVANSQSDTISVIDVATNRLRTINVSPNTATGKLQGASPSGMALSPDQNTLYAALSDMNAVAVIDLVHGRTTGYIPTGWYPTSVIWNNTGHKDALLVANGKGVRSHNPNPMHIKPMRPGQSESTYYSESIIEGTVSRIPLDHLDLKSATAVVLRNNLLVSERNPADVLPDAVRGMKGIKHVIYIVKENRTYDQVLGDVAEGNGDPELAIFGNSVTPNQHALAKRFVLLDNFYDCGEVSPDGWNWCTQGIANEFIIRNVPYNYSGRGREYDFEGSNNIYPTSGFPANDENGTPYSSLFPRGAPSIPDAGEAAGGHIWDSVHRAKLTYRNYGFWESDGVEGIVPDNLPTAKNLLPAEHYEHGNPSSVTIGFTDPDFRSFDTDYPDSSAAVAGYPTTAYGKYASRSRFDEWNREFRAMLQNSPDGSSVPAFMMVRFMSDHTAGFKLGKATPAGHVADNDYAVGEFVEAISESPIWKSTAIFVVEDDAQDGPDHVDCHRSTAYVISPWIQPHSIDHGFYNTDSILHTMEAMMGLPPMCQYDAIAPCIADFSTKPINTSKFVAVVPASIRQTVAASLPKGDPRWELVKETAKMDFSKEDLPDPQKLNRVIWASVRGIASQMPSPKYGVIPDAKTTRLSNAGRTNLNLDNDAIQKKP